MVDFINRLTESQALDKVHKMLRTDSDKKKNQPEPEESEFEKKDEEEGPKDELLLSSDKTKRKKQALSRNLPLMNRQKRKLKVINRVVKTQTATLTLPSELNQTGS